MDWICEVWHSGVEEDGSFVAQSKNSRGLVPAVETCRGGKYYEKQQQ